MSSVSMTAVLVMRYSQLEDHMMTSKNKFADMDKLIINNQSIIVKLLREESN